MEKEREWLGGGGKETYFLKSGKYNVFYRIQLNFEKYGNTAIWRSFFPPTFVIMFIDCKWVDTRWQWSFNMLQMHGLWMLTV